MNQGENEEQKRENYEKEQIYLWGRHIMENHIQLLINREDTTEHETTWILEFLSLNAHHLATKCYVETDL